MFCGAGGLTLGLEAAGLSTVLALDNWDAAVDTFRRNFPQTPVLAGDARDVGPADLLAAANLSHPPASIVGGPPCQGFSSAGARKPGDERNNLVRIFARLVAELRPRAFLFENVEGFLTSEDGAYVIDLLDPVVEAGYLVHLRKVNVANYGVGQLRKRVIALGALGNEPHFPRPTHRARGAPGARLVGAPSLPLSPTLAEALDGLPPAADRPPGIPSDHYFRPLNSIELARIRALLPGQTMRDLPPGLWHPSYPRRARRRVMDGTPTERRGGAPAGLRRLRSDEPSKAITGAAFREFIHPTEDRPLTLRECARLQTFPDPFGFVGSQSEKAPLIGNAVPPAFGRVLGEAIKATLASVDIALSGTGRLLSFEPTASEGMSPALEAVTRLVRKRYGLTKELEPEPLWA